ncbi:MAG: c-type cytochrome [Alphaproteobacteria bacterium]
MKKLWILGAVALFGAGTLAVQAAAAPADSVKYRQSMMRGVGAAMGNLSAMVKGDVKFGNNHLRANAESLAWLSSLSREAFLENTGTTGPTKAKANIWSNWSDYAGKAQALEIEAGKLVELARAPNPNMAAIGEQMKAVGGACGACHKEFRE